jgi:hypothetical protein
MSIFPFAIARSAGRHQRGQRAPFTLVELLAAMAVFTILMLMLFTFLSSAQRVWSATDSTTRTYENARVAFDLITRDLQCAVASYRGDTLTPLYVWPAAGGPNGERLSFVSRVECTSDAKSDLAEICYAWRSDSAAGDNRYWLRRSRDCDRTSSGDNPRWDFFHRMDAVWAVNATTGHGTLEKVVSGVEDLRITCLGQVLPPHDPVDSPPLVPADRVTCQLPEAVTVTLTLFDDKLTSAPTQVRDKSRRTFTKTIFTGAKN